MSSTPPNSHRQTGALKQLLSDFSLATRGLSNYCKDIWTKMNISANHSAHQPHVVLPVKCRWPMRKLCCVSRQTCLSKSGKRHSKPSMEMGTTIKTAAAPTSLCYACIFFYRFIHVVDPVRSPPGCCHHESHVLASSYQLSLCSPVLHTICMLTTWSWKRRGFFLRRPGRCTFMNGRHCAPGSPQQPSF